MAALRLCTESEDCEFCVFDPDSGFVLLFLFSAVGFLSGLVCVVLKVVLIDFNRATWCVIFV